MDKTLQKPFSLQGLSQRVVTLPKALRAVYVDEGMVDIFDAIEKKYSLSNEQINYVVRVTSRIMLGVFPLNNFVRALADTEGVGELIARDVAKDINEQIFQPVRKELMEVHNISPNNGLPINGNLSAPPQQLPAPSTLSQEESSPQKAQKMDDPREQAEVGARREELLERLRQSQEGSGVSADQEKDVGSGDDENNTKATTAAWNGKKIDLSMLPPRRKVKKEQRQGDKKSGENYVRLKKGSDGFYYEA